MAGTCVRCKKKPRATGTTLCKACLRIAKNRTHIKVRPPILYR